MGFQFEEGIDGEFEASSIHVLNGQQSGQVKSINTIDSLTEGWTKESLLSAEAQQRMEDEQIEVIRRMLDDEESHKE